MVEVDSIGTPILWVTFILFVIAVLLLDLGVFQKKPKEMKFKEALYWCSFWFGLAIAFNIAIYLLVDADHAIAFLTGYVIEQSLSVDNIFIFIIIFSYFKIPPKYQHRVLFYGILGAVLFRGTFVWLGAELLHHFVWTYYIFGAIIIASGIKLLLQKADHMDPGKNPVVKTFQRYIPVTENLHGERFFVKLNGKLMATPLALVLVCLEFTDVVFAVDSVPAIFAITSDPFIVFTSNIFAILGLRSIYFLISGAMAKLRYLNIGLSLILIFVGIKMLLANFFKIPSGISLLVVGLLLGTSIGFSILANKTQKKA